MQNPTPDPARKDFMIFYAGLFLRLAEGNKILEILEILDKQDIPGGSHP
jgi:hypothetical protein